MIALIVAVPGCTSTGGEVQTRAPGGLEDSRFAISNAASCDPFVDDARERDGLNELRRAKVADLVSRDTGASFAITFSSLKDSAYVTTLLEPIRAQPTGVMIEIAPFVGNTAGRATYLFEPHEDFSAGLRRAIEVTQANQTRLEHYSVQDQGRVVAGLASLRPTEPIVRGVQLKAVATSDIARLFTSPDVYSVGMDLDSTLLPLDGESLTRRRGACSP